jgi:REP element-mobilizing transposase RayT
MIRGIERRNIFKNNKDREDLIERLSNVLPETETACYAWAFMPNHAHFLFKTGNVPLSTIMRRLLTGYAVSFNRRHTRHGYLFQNRYKSIICQEDVYLRELVRYIHLNPVRGGIISTLSELNEYGYCGHSVIMGKRKRPWQDTEYVLGCFGKSLGRAREEYSSYVETGFEQGYREELTGGGLIRSLGGWSEIKKHGLKGRDHIKSDERILGESNFVSNVLSEAEEAFDRKYELKSLGYNLDRVATRVAEICEIETEEIYMKGKQRKRVKARSLLCYWAVRELGLSLTELAQLLDISLPAVSYSVERGEEIAYNNYRLIDQNLIRASHYTLIS